MRIERMIIGTDFGAPSIAGARWATSAFAPDADVILAHVIVPPQLPGFAAEPAASAAEREIAAHDAAAARLADVATVLPEGRVRTALCSGKPHVVLADLAEETGADVIVIGPHGDRPRTWRRFGTTADRLVRISRVPVLVFIGAPASPPRRLLVPLEDVGDPALTAAVLRWTRQLARAFDAEVVLLSVVAMSDAESALRIPAHAGAIAGVGSAAYTGPASREAVRAAGLRWLGDMAVTEIPGVRVSTAVAFGDPGDAIVDAAALAHTDLILLGRRNARTAAPETLGSTIATVLQGAACPVLVLIEPTDAASDEW